VGIIEHLLYIKLLEVFMKKHSFAMVFLLILILSLIGAVSASDDVSTCDVEAPICQSQDYAQIEIANDYESDSLESTVSISNDEMEDMDVDTSTVSSHGSYSSYYVSPNSFEDCLDDNVGDYVSTCQLSVDDNSMISSSDEAIETNLGEPISQNLVLKPDSTDSGNQLGYDISNALGSLSDLNFAGDDFTVTVDVSKINKLAIENVLNEIISSSNGYVINGYDKLLDLSSIETGLINIVFIKRDKSLTIALNYADRTVYYSAGQEISAGLWDKIVYSLSNGVLTQPGGCSEKTSENEIYKVAYYPTEFDLPLEDTSYYVLGVPRDSDADAFIWSIDNTSGKRACIGVALVNESIDGLLSQSLDDVVSQQSQSLDLTSLDLRQIGIDATKKALAYFKSKGINIAKGYPKLYVLTSASYVKIKGTSTESVLDGISEVLGSKKNIFPIHTPLWKDLVFYYLWVNNANNRDMLSYALRYDEATNRLVVSDDVKKQGDDIAYRMGLYDKYSPKPHPHNHGQKSIVNPFEESTSIDVNNTVNVTDSKKDNNTNETVIIDISKKLIEDIPAVETNPYKILVVLASIAIVCIFFRLSYTKKD
jgi:hypothetical protein